MTTNREKRKTGGRWWKISAAVLLLLCFVIAVAVVQIDSLALSLVNKTLNTHLLAGGKLKSVRLDLLAGRCDLEDLTLAQPAGYTEAAPLSLQRLSVRIDSASLLEDEIVIPEIVVNNLTLRLVRDTHGQFNVEKLLVASESPRPEPAAAEDDLSLPAIRVNSLSIKDLLIDIVDHHTKNRWQTQLQIDLKINDLQLRDIFQSDIVAGHIVLALKNLAVDEPAGFGSGKIFKLDSLTVKTDSFDLSAPHHSLKSVVVQGFDFSAAVHKDGTTNVQQLLAAVTEALPQTSGGKPRQNSSAAPLPVIRIGEISVDDGHVAFHDEALMEKILELSLQNLSLRIRKLTLFDLDPAVAPAALKLTFELPQPEPLPTAYFCAFASLGPVGSGVPQLNAQTRLIGLKLDTLGALIAPAERKAIGASGLDSGAVLALNADAIKLHGRALTDRNIIYDTFDVVGPLAAPEIKIGALMAGLSRIKGGLFNLGKGGLSATVSVGKAGVDITRGVGLGAYRLGKNLGGSLFNIGAGLATLDSSRAGKGVVGTTGGTLGLTSDMVTSTGSTTASGLRDSATSLGGGGVVDAWDLAIPERYQAALIQAEEALAAMPYPPVTD